MGNVDSICKLIDQIVDDGLGGRHEVAESKMRLADEMVAELKGSGDVKSIAAVASKYLEKLITFSEDEEELADLRELHRFTQDVVSGEVKSVDELVLRTIGRVAMRFKQT